MPSRAFRTGVRSRICPQKRDVSRRSSGITVSAPQWRLRIADMNRHLITTNNNASCALLFSFRSSIARFYCVLQHFVGQTCASTPMTVLTTDTSVDISREMTSACTLRTQQAHHSSLTSLNKVVLRGFSAIFKHMTDGENGTAVARYMA